MTPSSAAQTATTERYDAYMGIHKALRHFMCDTLHAVGRLDTGDEKEVAKTLEQARGLIHFCEHHLQNENKFVHPAMEARRPGCTGNIVKDHEHHEESFGMLLKLIDEVEQARGDEKDRLAHKLYIKLSLFVGENFVHMYEEETENNRVIWECYTDGEIKALEGEIVASLTPEQNMIGLRWMIPAMSPKRRAEFLSGVQKMVPPPAFQMMMAGVRQFLSVRDWEKLADDLELEEAVA